MESSSSFVEHASEAVRTLNNEQLKRALEDQSNGAGYDECLNPLIYSSGKRQRTMDDSSEDEVLEIGVGLDDSSFVVPELQEHNRDRPVLRQDGLTWDRTGPNKDYRGPFNKDWMDEFELRRKLLEANPDYSFFSLVAGFANSPIEQLYDVGDIQTIIRRERSIEAQERASLARAGQIKLTQRQQELADLRGIIEAAKVNLDRLKKTEKTWTDQFRQLLTLADHARLFTAMHKLLSEIGTEILSPLKDKYRTGTVAIDDGTFASVAVYWREVKDLNKKARNIHAELEEAKKNLPQAYATGIRLRFHAFDKTESTSGKTTVEREDELKKIIDDILNVAFLWISSFKEDGAFEKWKKEAPLEEKLAYLSREEANGFQRLRNSIDRQQENARETLARSFVSSLVDLSGISYPYLYRDELTARWPQTIGPPLSLGNDLDPVETNEFLDDYLENVGEDFDSISTDVYKNAESDLKKKDPGSYADLVKLTRGMPGWKSIFALGVVAKRTRLSVGELQSKLRRHIQNKDSLERAINAQLEGRPIVRPPQVDYQHTISWLQRPENSGIVRLKDTVKAALNDAYRVFKEFAWKKSSARKRDIWGNFEESPSRGALPSVDELERSDVARTAFAQLVSTSMSQAAVAHPRQYYQANFMENLMNQRENALSYLRDKLVYAGNSITEK